jgi:capsular polysaccharide biosynthesis protein
MRDLFNKLFVRELFKTTNKVKLRILIYLANLLLNVDKKIYSKKARFLDLAPALNKQVILPEALTKTYFPNYTSSKIDDFVAFNSPEVQLLELEGFIVSGGSSSFIKDNNLYIERFCNEENENAVYDSGSVLSHNNKYALVRQSDLKFVDNGFFLAGNGSWNYYHWLVEILPKLQIYLELGLYKQGIKLLVPDVVKENVNLKFLLDSVIGDIKIDIVFVSLKFSLHVKHLFHVTPINNILFNERKVGLSTNTLHLRYDSLTFLTSQIEHFISLNDNEMLSFERIFLARKGGGGRDYNQSDILPFLIKNKFKIIYMEEYDIRQQIFIFKNAKYIVGASGAAWTNLIFCNNSCKALSWLPESIPKFPAFSTLANFSNIELSFFNTSSSHYKNIHDNYAIDLDIFEMHLNKLLE